MVEVVPPIPRSGWRAIGWAVAALAFLSLMHPFAMVPSLWCAYKAGQNVQRWEDGRG